jgi:hypothetical protein
MAAFSAPSSLPAKSQFFRPMIICLIWRSEWLLSIERYGASVYRFGAFQLFNAYLRKGIIGLEHLATEDMLALAKLLLRVKRLQRKIRKLKDVSWDRRRRAREKWLEAVT